MTLSTTKAKVTEQNKVIKYSEFNISVKTQGWFISGWSRPKWAETVEEK